LDPWGADTPRSNNAAFQPKKFTSYERDGNGSDEAMFRRYNRWHSRFDQPDPYEGSVSLTNPQSLNRYAYVHGDPVNFVDPSGLRMQYCYDIYRGDGHSEPECFGAFDPYSAFEPKDSAGGKDGASGEDTGKEPDQQQDDCHRFAELVQGIADRTKNDKEFLDELARTFTSANDSSVAEMRDNSGGPVVPPRLSFGDSGFKPRFQDGSNQVRHFVAGFIAGADLGLPGLWIMNEREDGENADTRLNGESTNLGSWFTGQASSLEFRRARLADQIRKDVCQ
jgi:RHS repeat-associated protein